MLCQASHGPPAGFPRQEIPNEPSLGPTQRKGNHLHPSPDEAAPAAISSAVVTLNAKTTGSGQIGTLDTTLLPSGLHYVLLNPATDSRKPGTDETIPRACEDTVLDATGVTFAVVHMIDRACVGRCFSYANYEASTAQFRIRAVAENPYVTSRYRDSWAMQAGKYVVQDRDLPLLQLVLDSGGRMVVRSLKAGVPCGGTPLKAIPDLFPLS